MYGRIAVRDRTPNHLIIGWDHSCILLLFSAQQPTVGQGLLIHDVSRSHTTTHHSQQDSSGRVISSSQRPLPYNTQHLQKTDIHAPGGIRTQNPSRTAAAYPRLRPRGHWDRPQVYIGQYNNNNHTIQRIYAEDLGFCTRHDHHQFL